MAPRILSLTLAILFVGVGPAGAFHPGSGTADPPGPVDPVLVSPTSGDGRYTQVAPEWAWEAPDSDAGLAGYEVLILGRSGVRSVSEPRFTDPLLSGEICIRVRAVDVNEHRGPFSGFHCIFYDAQAPEIVVEAPRAGVVYFRGVPLDVDHFAEGAPALVIGALRIDARLKDDFELDAASIEVDGAHGRNCEYSSFATDETMCRWTDDVPPPAGGVAVRPLVVRALDGAGNEAVHTSTYTKVDLAVIESECPGRPGLYCNTLLAGDIAENAEAPVLAYTRDSAGLWRPLMVHAGSAGWPPAGLLDPVPTVAGETREYQLMTVTGELEVRWSNIATITAAHDGVRVGSYS